MPRFQTWLFPVFKEDDVFPSSDDQKLLQSSLHEAHQDDDVDTDDDLLADAQERCRVDLENAERKALKPDGTIRLVVLRN